MSYTPNGFAGNEPTGAGRVTSHRLPQSSQCARFEPISSPHQYAVRPAELNVPTGLLCARATYSHSASLSNRYSCPVFPDSHRTYAFASFQLTARTGPRGRLARGQGLS